MIMTTATAHQTAHRNGERLLASGEAAGTGGAAVGAVVAGCEVGAALDVSYVMVHSQLIVGLQAQARGEREAAKTHHSVNPAVPMAIRATGGRSHTHRVFEANQGDKVIVNRIEVVLLGAG